MKPVKLLSLFALGLFPSISFAQQTNIVVKKGEKYKVESSTKLTSTAEVMGQSMESNMDNKTTTVYEVTDVESAEIKLESTLTKILMETSTMGQNMSYDSDKKDNEGPMAELASKMLNKKNTIKLDSKGTITKQDSPEESLPGMMGGGGNESALELFIPVLIGKELKPGDSYPDTHEVKSEKVNSLDSGVYKITAIENGIASITYSGTQISTREMEQMGMEMTNTSHNTITTEFQVDIRTGRVLVKASVTESVITIEAGGMSIPATAKTITTVTISAVN